MTGTVRVRNLAFQGKHGASAAERRSSRRFQVDVDLTWDMSRATETDRLADTVDYYELCGMIVELGEARAYRLLEALAASMLRSIKARWPQVSVEIELRKLHPPCPGNPDFTAARIKG